MFVLAADASAFGCPQRVQPLFRALHGGQHVRTIAARLCSQSVRDARRAERFCVFEVRVWAGIKHAPGEYHAPSSAAASSRGEASSQRRSGSRFTRHEGGLPQRAHGAGRAAPRVTMDPQEEVRAAQDEVKQLKAQLAALQQLQASPPKLRQGLKIPGLKNTGTTLNYIADGAGSGEDPLNRPRRSPRAAAARRARLRSGGIGSWWTRRSPRRI